MKKKLNSWISQHDIDCLVNKRSDHGRGEVFYERNACDANGNEQWLYEINNLI